MGWHEDGHSAALFIDDEVMRARLQCPGDEFCEAKQRCHVCEGEGKVISGPYRGETCEHCEGSGTEPGTCHLIDWAENVCPMEMHHGRTDLYGQTFPAAIRWEYGDSEEGPRWRFADSEDYEELFPNAGALWERYEKFMKWLDEELGVTDGSPA